VVGMCEIDNLLRKTACENGLKKEIAADLDICNANNGAPRRPITESCTWSCGHGL
jgi:hypothetical protein